MLVEPCTQQRYEPGARGVGPLVTGWGAMCAHVRRLCRRVCGMGIRPVYKLSILGGVHSNFDYLSN